MTRGAASAKLALDIAPRIHNHRVVDNISAVFAALSDPTRRALIERLSHGPASVNRLTEPFAVSQQMISKHIAQLERARIVVKTKRGRESICTLRPKAIKTVNDWAIGYRRFWEESFDKLDAVVIQMKKAEVKHDKKHGE
ncbi:MAG: ArsR/SmtB family transcription factor [Terriglobales bacterium]